MWRASGWCSVPAGRRRARPETVLSSSDKGGFRSALLLFSGAYLRLEEEQRTPDVSLFAAPARLRKQGGVLHSTRALEAVLIGSPAWVVSDPAGRQRARAAALPTSVISAASGMLERTRSTRTVALSIVSFVVCDYVAPRAGFHGGTIDIPRDARDEIGFPVGARSHCGLMEAPDL